MKTRKLKLVTIVAGVFALFLSPGFASEGHDHDHGHEHGDHGIEAGPNGGRMIESVTPHIEFFLREDRYVQLTFVNESGKVVPAGNQKITVHGGDRMKPTKLKFEKAGDVLISDQALPDENNMPIIVQIKMAEGEKTIREKFNLNTSKCPSCSLAEYACECHGDDHDHDHAHGHGHDHGDHSH
jgi:hypothetical protein